MFTQRCFIKKNNAELLRKLEEIGRTFVPNGYGEWNIPIEKCEYLYCGDESWQGGRLYFYTGKVCKPEDGIKCVSEELFLALAALRDDSDLMQYFVSEVRLGSINTDSVIPKGYLIKCLTDKWCYPKNDYDSMCIPAHKATVEELINHFNK